MKQDESKAAVLIPQDLFQIMDRVYPVGSVYMNTVDSRDPFVIFGFGRWTAITQRVLVGKHSSGTFNTLGGTGGAETHTLTTPEMPAHTHSVNAQITNAGLFGLKNPGDYVTTINQAVTSSSTGGGGAHNNLQPYKVVMMWERVA